MSRASFFFSETDEVTPAPKQQYVYTDETSYNGVR